MWVFQFFLSLLLIRLNSFTPAFTLSFTFYMTLSLLYHVLRKHIQFFRFPDCSLHSHSLVQSENRRRFHLYLWLTSTRKLTSIVFHSHCLRNERLSNRRKIWNALPQNKPTRAETVNYFQFVPIDRKVHEQG